MEIRDHYPKYIVTLNEMDTGIENGIKIVHLMDFYWQSNGKSIEKNNDYSEKVSGENRKIFIRVFSC